MIIQSLNPAFKIIDPKLVNKSEDQLNYLVNLINNDNEIEFQKLALDISGWWNKANNAYRDLYGKQQPNIRGNFDTIEGYAKACVEYKIYTREANPRVDANIDNICLIFHLSKPIHEKLNGLNTIAIFCDFVINGVGVAPNIAIQSELVIKRIELLEISTNIKQTTSVQIRLNADNTTTPDPNFLKVLKEMHPEIEFGKKQDSQLRKFLRYDDWSRLIPALRDYYNKKNNDDVKNYQKLLFFEKDTKFTIDDPVKCYILHEKGTPSIFTSRSNKYYLINKKDENIKYRIEVSNHDDKLNKLLDELKQFKNSLDQDVQNLNKVNESISSKKDEFSHANEQISNDLLAKKDELSQIESKFNQLNASKKSFETKLDNTKAQLKILNTQQDKLSKLLLEINKKVLTCLFFLLFIIIFFTIHSDTLL